MKVSVAGSVGLAAFSEKPVRLQILACGMVLTAAACAAPSTRIAMGLERYGLDAQRSQCVGDRLQKNLSLGQLMQLGKAASAYGRGDSDPTRLTASDLIRVAGQIDDPKVPLEVGKAVAACGVIG